MPDQTSNGSVTSACYSPRLEKKIGNAMLPIEFAELGTELAVETPDERTSAIVVRKPFIDPQKEIPKQHLAAAAAKNDPHVWRCRALGDPAPATPECRRRFEASCLLASRLLGSEGARPVFRT